MENQQDVFAGLFYGSIILFAVIELLLPKVPLRHGIGARWSTNIVLGLTNIVAIGLIVPIGSVALSLYVEGEGWGLMNWLPVPGWLAVIVGILAMDIGKYAEHWLMHQVPFLWRLHAVHHSDLDADFTTGFRHHPLEALVSAVTAPAVILLMGVPPLGVVIFLSLAAISSIYTHANVRYHRTIDRVLRVLFMTRDAHVVHHSAHREETNSNYGQVFLFWDRLFGTYRAAPKEGLNDITIGLEYFREPRDLWIHNVLTMPFRVPRSGLTAPVSESEPEPDKQPAPPAS
jgi:sterol desaturase/sphingolipid hydroxylase (fatty acid hydroxylase superfamily)